MITWPVKTPNEVVPRTIEWGAALQADTIATNSLTVTDGSAVIDAYSVDVSGQIVSATISGGTDGETTTFLNTIITAAGFRYEETITLDVVSSEFPVGPSTTRKRAIIEMAIEELRMAGYEFNFTPERYAASLRRLDGIAQLYPLSGYNQPAVFGEGEVDDASGLYDTDVADFAVMLAEAIAPMIGKTLSANTIRRVTATRIRLNARYAVIPTVGLAPGTPLGSGNKRLTANRGAYADGTNA